MANEITVNASLNVNNFNQLYQSSPSVVRANQVNNNGPTPGAVVVLTSGVIISLAALVLPGYAQLHNLDRTNYVEYGLHDGSTFRPFGELLPGDIAVFRFSRRMLTANGTADGFYLKANSATCNVQVNCFDA